MIIRLLGFGKTICQLCLCFPNLDSRGLSVINLFGTNFNVGNHIMSLVKLGKHFWDVLTKYDYRMLTAETLGESNSVEKVKSISSNIH